MAGNIFNRGYGASRAEKERQDRSRENSGRRLWRFFLKEDGEEASLHFLTEEPVNFYEHTVRAGDRYEQHACTAAAGQCPFCASGDRPTYKGAYLVVDHRPYEYVDRDGNRKGGKDRLRLFVMGMRVVSQLDRISERYGLSNRDVTIVRLGRGTQTTYTVERGDESKYSQQEVSDFLPDALRAEYNGTQESLMDIIEGQLMMSADAPRPAQQEGPSRAYPNGGYSSAYGGEPREPEGEGAYDARDKLISVGDAPQRKRSLFKRN